MKPKMPQTGPVFPEGWQVRIHLCVFVPVSVTCHVCVLCVCSSAYPQYALHVLTQAVQRANLPPHREEKLLAAISALNQCIGSCEKLLRYPIPLSYTRHTSRFMVGAQPASHL